MLRSCMGAALFIFVGTTAFAQNVTVALAPNAVASLQTEMSRAQSPEEAAKYFARIASELIGQAVADALHRTVGAVSPLTTANAKITGWEKYIIDNGMGLTFQWPTPALSTAGILPAKSFTGRSAGPAPAITGSISITIGGSF